MLTILTWPTRPTTQPRHLLCLSRVAALIAILLLWTPLVAAAAEGDASSFDLEQILGSPFPSGLVVAPSGGHVAWVFNHRGVRNVWVASPPEYGGRALTDYREDDGQELTSLTFSPQGNRIAFVRGGAPNASGELPNPLSRTVAAERVIWEATLDGGALRRIGEGSSPLYLPDGGLLLLRKGEVWRAVDPDAASKGGRRNRKAPAAATSEPKLLIAGRGSFGNLRLSPDGMKLAFTNGRGTHGYVGVFDLET